MTEHDSRTRPLLGITHYCTDLAIIWLTLLSIVEIYQLEWTNLWITFLLYALLLHSVIFSLQSYYIRGRYEKFSIVSIRLFVAWGLVVLAILGIGFVTKTSSSYSRFVVILWSITTPILLFLSLLWVRFLKRQYDQKDANYNNTLVIGTDTHAHLLFQKLVTQQAAETCLGLVPVEGQSLDTNDSVRILGHIEHIRDIVTDNRIRKIYIALGLKYSERVEKIQLALLDLNVDVIWAPDIHNFNLINHSITSFQGLPLIAINQSPLTASESAALAKNALDKLTALAALILFSPLMLATAFAVKISSPGSILFIQDRTGFDGETFQVWKFRSMKIHSELNGEITQAKNGDDRFTRVGNFIRKTSLDEFPQLFNVLRGEMSMVGPRPHALAHNEIYSNKINAYMARHRMKPGITGWAQVHGFRGETETDDKMESRVQLDLEYINKWSIWMDIRILAMTPIALIRYGAQ